MFINYQLANNLIGVHVTQIIVIIYLKLKELIFFFTFVNIIPHY